MLFIPWKTWEFQIKQWPWASSIPHRTSWTVELPFTLSTLPIEDHGYQSHAVDLDLLPSSDPNISPQE